MSTPDGPGAPGGQPGFPPPPPEGHPSYPPAGQPGYPPPPVAPPPPISPPPGPAPEWAPPPGPQGYYPPPGQQGPPPKTSNRRNLIVIGVCALIILAIAGAFWVFRDRLSGEAAGLQVGDCIDLPTSESTFTDVQHQPCNLPHDAEVILVFTHPAPPGEAYPVVSGFDDVALAQCLPAFESYVGRDYETDPDLVIGYFHPTLTGWGEGDRGFTCHAKRIDNAKLAATIRAGGAPASP